MKRALVVLVVLLAAVLATVVWNQREEWFGNGGANDPGKGTTGPGKGQEEAGTSRPTTNPKGEQRTPVDAKNGRSADTVRYRILDLESRQPIPNARVILMRDGSVVARTDDDGFAEVERHGLMQLAFGAEGHLSDFWTNREAEAQQIAAGFEKDGYLKILLREDAFTVSFEFVFKGPGGKAPTGLRFRVRATSEPLPGGRSIPTAGGVVEITPEVRASWLRHYQLGLLPGEGYRENPTHFGVDSHILDYESDGRTKLRFVAIGFYEIEARSKEGWFASQRFEVRDHQARPLIVTLAKGRFFRGVVSSAKDGKWVVGAMVLQEEPVAGKEDLFSVTDMATTDAKGRFEFGPLPNKVVALRFQHGLFETKRLTGQRPGFDEKQVKLTPRATRKLHGWVSERGTRAPVFAGAVELVKDGTVLAKAKVSAGRFELDAPANEVVIRIEAAGFERYQERLEASELPSRYELLPDSAERRVAAGLTTIIEGVVTGPDSKPAVGVPVQLVPLARPVMPAVPAGRLIFSGFAIRAKNVVTTDKNGGFQLEWPYAGPVRVRAVRGIASKDQGVLLQAVPGRRSSGVKLQVGR